MTGLYNKIKPFLADASRLPTEQIAVNRIGMFGDAETRIQAIERRHNKLPPGPPFFAGIIYSGEGGDDYDKVVI